MRKLRLDVEALKVEEFSTTGDGVGDRGTVRGHYDRSYPNWGCPITWGNYGCQSVSGEVACICIDRSDGECESNGCTQTQYVEFCQG